ncbi:MAG: serine/threonine-protein kinase [Phycisphaerae bacterium]
MESTLFQRLEEAFDRCREATPAERDSIIAELGRRSEEAAERLRGMLDTPALDRERIAELIAEVGTGDNEPEAIDARRVIGKYTLLSVLGEGGWGIVYLAEQPAPTHRLVAVKIIKPGMDTRQVLARFNDERQALAMMDHPCVVTSIDAGATDDGRPYVVMPLIPGLSITSFCNEEKLDVAARVRILAKACRGIEHAHAKGVIHRDIKPANILVARTDGEILPRVIDFGLAKALTDPLTPHATVTLAGQVIGTPEYMSPEQAQGPGADVRADVYSLGAVLYELLAGRPPIDPATIRANGASGVAAVLKRVVPPPPSKFAAGAFRRELDWIVQRCLEKEPQRRYATVAALADDLERYLAGDRVLAGPPAKLYRAWRWGIKHRVTLAAGVAVAASIVAGWWYAERARGRAEKVAQVTRSLLTSVAPAVARGRATELLLMMLDQGKAVLDDPNLDPRVELDLRETFALANSTVGRHLEAGVHAKRADELVQRFEGERSARRLPMLRVILLANRNGAATDTGAIAMNKAIDAVMVEIASANAARDPNLPLITEVDIMTAHEGGEVSRMHSALEACQATFGERSVHTIRMMRQLARRLIDERKPEGAAMMEEARRLAAETFGPDHPLVHSSLSVEMLGATLCDCTPEEQYRRVIDLSRERASEAERVLGWRSQQMAYVYNNYGRCLSRLGDQANAIVQLERALDIESRARTDASGVARLVRMNLLEAAIVGDRPDIAAACDARIFELEPEGPAVGVGAYDDIIKALVAKGDRSMLERWTGAKNRRYPDAAR